MNSSSRRNLIVHLFKQTNQTRSDKIKSICIIIAWEEKHSVWWNITRQAWQVANIIFSIFIWLSITYQKLVVKVITFLLPLFLTSKSYTLFRITYTVWLWMKKGCCAFLLLIILLSSALSINVLKTCKIEIHSNLLLRNLQKHCLQENVLFPVKWFFSPQEKLGYKKTCVRRKKFLFLLKHLAWDIENDYM